LKKRLRPESVPRTGAQEDAPATFHNAGTEFVADTCQPLVAAAQAGRVQLCARGRAGYPGKRLPKEELEGLCSIGYWNAEFQQDWGLPPHRNEGIEISYLASGLTDVTIEGQHKLLHHDELLITRPWQEHAIGNPNIQPCRLVWVIIDVQVRRPHQEWRWPAWTLLSRKDISELTCLLRQNEQYIWAGTTALRQAFSRLRRALEASTENNCSLLAVLVNEVLLGLLEMFRQSNVPLKESLTSSERTVRIFQKELEGALDQPWTLDAMAESCHMGVTQFVHYFRTVTNLTPAHFLARARLEQAKRLLLSDPGRSVTDIAFACGFNSSQYFSSVFRKEFGSSPRGFRSQASRE
jgi:AraC family L-rhamnose operon regulatory protein RhaS